MNPNLLSKKNYKKLIFHLGSKSNNKKKYTVALPFSFSSK